jgi:hypothetical protein
MLVIKQLFTFFKVRCSIEKPILNLSKNGQMLQPTLSSTQELTHLFELYIHSSRLLISPKEHLGRRKRGTTIFSIMIFGIMPLSIKRSFENFSIMTSSITTLCHHAKCQYAECRILLIVMLSVLVPGGEAASLSEY